MFWLRIFVQFRKQKSIRLANYVKACELEESEGRRKKPFLSTSYRLFGVKRLAAMCRMSTDKWASWREWLLRDSLCKSHEKNRCEKCPRKNRFPRKRFPFWQPVSKSRKITKHSLFYALIKSQFQSWFKRLSNVTVKGFRFCFLLRFFALTEMGHKIAARASRK